MNTVINPIIGNGEYSFGRKKYKNPYGPIDRKLPRDELIIKRTKESLYRDAAMGIIATCFIYFQFKKMDVINDVRQKAIRQYARVRVGQAPERPRPMEFSEQEKKKAEEKAKKEAEEAQKAAEEAKKAEEEIKKAKEEAKAIEAQNSQSAEEELINSGILEELEKTKEAE